MTTLAELERAKAALSDFHMAAHGCAGLLQGLLNNNDVPGHMLPLVADTLARYAVAQAQADSACPTVPA